MKKLIRTALFATVFVGASAASEETLLEYVIDACEDDIVEYCDRVTPGEGRLLYCMAAYEDQITTKCSVALYQAAGILQELANAVAYVATACGADIESHCADTPMGEGRILACLEENSASLSESCSAAISDGDEE